MMQSRVEKRIQEIDENIERWRQLLSTGDYDDPAEPDIDHDPHAQTAHLGGDLGIS
jgi:hypothetical protein